MANLTQSNQSVTTTAPGYYNDYLATLANQGMNAAANAQFVGPTALQNQAFSGVTDASQAYQPTLNAAGTTLANAGASPSPLAAGANYLNAATQSPAQLAQSYMSPYLNTVVNQLGDVNQRNIQQNLAPLAMAGGIGSGQYGSLRADQALGQTINNANQNTLAQQFQALNTGYNTALTTAEQQNALEGQLGATAGNQASQGQVNLTNLGNAQDTLAQTNQNLGLNAINAQDTLGTQLQTIAQNQQNYPLTKLTTLAGLMNGQSVPTSTSTTMTPSILGGIATVGALGNGLVDTTLGKQALSSISSALGLNSGPTATNSSGTSVNGATPSQTIANLQNINNAGGLNDYIPGYGTAPTNPTPLNTNEIVTPTSNSGSFDINPSTDPTLVDQNGP